MRNAAGEAKAAADLDHPYLKKQLIAYIGNKRTLQPLLFKVFGGIAGSRVAGWNSERRHGSAPVFLDPFAGSGCVPRLARYMGYRVLANDWEYYAYVLNYAHLGIGSSEAQSLFRTGGGPAAVLAGLNSLTHPAAADCYLARHYAPAATNTADYRTERLFYTQENALIIDAIRSRIETLYPGFPGELNTGDQAHTAAENSKKEKLLLLAALLYQCATHTNTSGVFKACHKGFGGHGRDALGRILSPVRLQMPVLIDRPDEAEVGCREALEFVRSRPADLCYLDPPYNQHQYGSNYHLLNTIARWDRPEVDDGLGKDGRLKHKAGIRRDWIGTRSDYCYRRSAGLALRRLLEGIDARHIVLSYNTEGIIPFEELEELMASQGRVSLIGNEYLKYRGGKQSIARQMHNLEFVLVLDRGYRTTASDRSGLEKAVLVNRLAVVMKRSFCPEKIGMWFAPGTGKDDSLTVRLDGAAVVVPMPHLYRFAPEAAAILVAAAVRGKAGETSRLLETLKLCECADHQEEIMVLLEILRDSGGLEVAEREALQKRILRLLRKFAHRKYRDRFGKTLGQLRSFGRRNPASFAPLLRGLQEVEALARARFAG